MNCHLQEQLCCCHAMFLSHAMFQVLLPCFEFCFCLVLSCFLVLGLFLVMFFPLSHQVHSSHLSLFHSCTPSPITSPQYLVSRFPSVQGKILTSLHASGSCLSRFGQVRFCCIFHSHSLVLFGFTAIVLSCLFIPQLRFLVYGSVAFFVLVLKINLVLLFEFCIWEV